MKLRGDRKRTNNREARISYFLKVAALILVTACSSLGMALISRDTNPASADSQPSVIVKVEGKEIPTKLFNMYLKNGVEALGLPEGSADGRQKIALLKEGIVSDLIDRALVEIELERRNIPVPQEKIDAALQRRVNEMGGPELCRVYLTKHGLSEDEFRGIARQELCGQILREELSREVTVNEEEVKQFYDRESHNPALADIFVESERVRASHILIGARRSQIAAEIKARENLTGAELERRASEEMHKRRARATFILSRVQAGADFASLARQYSDDPGTRARGGDLGLFTRDSHTAKFDEAAFALKPGETSRVVETEYGFHIIRVSEHRARRPMGLVEVRETLRQRLFDRKQAAHLKRWLETRRGEAKIVKS